MDNLFKLFNESENYELEARFGTKETINRTHFDEVIRKLKSCGFEAVNSVGHYELRIQNEFEDPTTGKTKISNIRGEISGLLQIQKYCKDNKPENIVFNRKQWVFHKGERVQSFEQPNFNFRINLKSEEILDFKHRLVKMTLQEWGRSKKIFRFMKRFTFKRKGFPLHIDCSIVKMSRRRGRKMISTKNIQESNVFNNPEVYEIEIEMNRGSSVEVGTFKMKQVIRYILSGIQGTNYPISFSEMNTIYKGYLKLIDKKTDRKHPRDFIGPSSISLEVENIMEKSNMNILKNYAVTDKADGIRKMLYIANNKKIYFLDTNMNIQFTGCIADNYANTLIDGEHVLYDKDGKFINLYLCFDIYYLSGENMTAFPLLYIEKMVYKKKIDTNVFRLNKLNDVLKDVSIKSIIDEGASTLSVRMKKFNHSSNIFNSCNAIISKIDDGLYAYMTDGLIITPIDKSVGSDVLGETLEPYKKTWTRSFKWKPPEFNTVDFLVTTKKMDNGQDFVGTVFQDGIDLSSGVSHINYKVLILRVGYDPVKHGLINPFEDVINNKTPKKAKRENRYVPRPFQPPGDDNAYLCYCTVTENAAGEYYMRTEDGEDTFEDGMIVEFRYDRSKGEYLKWIPIRVRYDKTSEYRKGIKNYGNAYHVALSVWRSIHNPVTKEMITTGTGIPEQLTDTDVYYNSSKETHTKALRDFHNKCVKKGLIEMVTKEGDTLIDVAVGKAGDLHKWMNVKCSFVFGMDMSRDNIENRKDGACARYLYSKMKTEIFDALFIQGDSAKNIRSGEACFTEKGKNITRAIFGEGMKSEDKIGKMAFNHYGVGINGFNVVSCQFALHYFFKSEDILGSFLKNIKECCAKDGYFIGTSYDGKKLFEKLKDIKKGESISAYEGEHKIWEIIKQYDDEEFQRTGLAVDVYQESINAYWREYLVDYDYLTEKLLELGFVTDMAGIASFKTIHDRLDDYSNIGLSRNMSDNELKISFLNNYFIYKKNN